MNEKYRMITKIVRNMKLKKAKGNLILNDNESETLRYITKHEGCISNDLVLYLNVDKALITRMIKKLEINGFIEVRDGEDKRKKHLYPTNKGLNLKLEDQLYEIEYYKDLFKDIDMDEQDTFFMTLEKVYLASKKRRKLESEKKI